MCGEKDVTETHVGALERRQFHHDTPDAVTAQVVLQLRVKVISATNQ